jgi:hypothetical protein
MSWTTKVLVIANRTVDSEEVREAIVSRAAAGPLQVMLVAPASGGASSLRERRAETAQRLERAVQRLRAAGVAVEGVVGDADPMVAVLPTGVSRWMAADLPRRVERFSGARVAHVVAASGRKRAASVAQDRS